MDTCLKNDQVQDEILEQRIEAQKKYKIESTQQLLSMKKNIQVKLIINNLKSYR